MFIKLEKEYGLHVFEVSKYKEIIECYMDLIRITQLSSVYSECCVRYYEAVMFGSFKYFVMFLHSIMEMIAPEGFEYIYNREDCYFEFAEKGEIKNDN